MIKDDQNYYNEKKFVRDDWGGQVLTPNSSRTRELTDDNNVNGSNNKPFPQEANWIRNDDPDGTLLKSRNEQPTQSPGTMSQPYGQAKYAVREGAESQYTDLTRNTADDNAATKKGISSTYAQVERRDEESQGI